MEILFFVHNADLFHFYPAPAEGEEEAFIRVTLERILQEGDEIFTKDNQVVGIAVIVDAVMAYPKTKDPRTQFWVVETSCLDVDDKRVPYREVLCQVMNDHGWSYD